jgi:hypothetical protein
MTLAEEDELQDDALGDADDGGGGAGQRAGSSDGESLDGEEDGLNPRAADAQPRRGLPLLTRQATDYLARLEEEAASSGPEGAALHTQQQLCREVSRRVNSCIVRRVIASPAVGEHNSSACSVSPLTWISTTSLRRTQ